MGNDYRPDPSLLKPFDSPEHQLWCAALHLLIDDAARYAAGVKPNIAAGMDDGKRAFEAVTQCGEPLLYLCQFLDYDAVAISERFCRNFGIIKKEFI